MRLERKQPFLSVDFSHFRSCLKPLYHSKRLNCQAWKNLSMAFSSRNSLQIHRILVKQDSSIILLSLLSTKKCIETQKVNFFPLRYGVPCDQFISLGANESRIRIQTPCESVKFACSQRSRECALNMSVSIPPLVGQ